MSLLPVADALSRILARACRLEDCETVALAEADRRVLAEDLVAARSQPPFAASAMDGYAVRAKDAGEGAILHVSGQAAAGHAYTGQLPPGEAVRIFTGAPVPPGADTVLIQENAEVLADGRVRVVHAAEPGRHIRGEGIDFRTGDTVLAAGITLDAGRLTLAAAVNRKALSVIRRPRVAILATGDELVAPGGTPRGDQIIASNGVGVATIAREKGAEVIDLGIAGDSLEGLADAIDEARMRADILVTLGGASVGDHDLVREALVQAGMTLDFWKIAMRPGKPLMSGRLGGMHVLGLPGNPVSGLVCAHLFLKPLVARLAGRAEAPDMRRATLGCEMAANDRRQDYVRARLEKRPDGEIVAHPFPWQDSSMMRVFADADGLVVRPPHAAPARAGDPCEIVLLRPAD